MASTLKTWLSIKELKLLLRTLNLIVINSDGAKLMVYVAVYGSSFLQGNENYIPIKEKGKIVGFIDNSESGKGLKYYHNGYTAGGKKLPEGALLAKNHGDYKALSKYVDVSKQSGASLDETSKVLETCFQKVWIPVRLNLMISLAFYLKKKERKMLAKVLSGITELL